MFEILSPRRGYDDLFDQLVAAVPSGAFYDFTRPIVTYGPDPYSFILKTDNPGYPIRIVAQRLGDYHPAADRSRIISVVDVQPQNDETTFRLSLGLGRNRIIARETMPGGRQAILEVIATPNALIIEPIAKEIFKSTYKISLQEQALLSAYSTRLFEQVFRQPDLLPDLQSIKILSAKLLVRAGVHFPATEIGVKDSIESYTINTPILLDQREPVEWNVERQRILTVVETEAGKEAHVWFPNLAVTRWLAFSKMADSFRTNFKIESIQDDQIDITYKGIPQTHSFDFDGEGASFLNTLMISDCFAHIQVSMGFGLTIRQKWCMWTYPFDSFISDTSPIGIGRASYDLNQPLDSNMPFDGDPVDPFSDGWVGWSLSGRFEFDAPGFPLDDSVSPAATYPGPPCSYPNGPYTQMLNTVNTEVPLAADITASGNWDDYVQGSIVGLRLALPEGPFTAGVAVPAVIKYVDSNNMTNASGFGNVSIQESSGGTLTPISVSMNGYASFNLTPTQAGQYINWTSDDGTYLDTTIPVQVLPGPFDALVLTTIGNQTVGSSFAVSIQAVDAYGNFVTDVGINTKVVINAKPGFLPASNTPTFVFLVNGAATVNLTMDQTGTGFLRFELNPVTQDSNTFTVS